MVIRQHKSKAQIAVVFALALVALVGVISLGVDVFLMYFNWQSLQKTADAAALAGGNYLSVYKFAGTPGTGCAGLPDDARIAACTYAVYNGYAASELTITEPTSSTIHVLVQRAGYPYYFGKVLGLTTYSLSASATAKQAGQVGTVSKGLFPIGLQCNTPCNLSNLDPGQSVSFGNKFVNGLAPGNWQWMDYGNGDAGLANAIQNGASGSYSIGNTISSQPGNKGNSNNVKNALSTRLSQCKSYSSDPCSGSNPSGVLQPGDPCVVIVPAVNFGGCTGSCRMTIQGFAEIYIEPAITTSTKIQGCFISSAVGDTISSSTGPALGPTQPPYLIQ